MSVLLTSSHDKYIMNVVVYNKSQKINIDLNVNLKHEV
jgi:hypothetical protein